AQFAALLAGGSLVAFLALAIEALSGCAPAQAMRARNLRAHAPLHRDPLRQWRGIRGFSMRSMRTRPNVASDRSPHRFLLSDPLTRPAAVPWTIGGASAAVGNLASAPAGESQRRS